MEGRYCVLCLIEYLKHCHESGNSQRLFYVVAKVGKLDVTADLPRRYEESHQSAQSTAINSRNIPQVQHDLARIVQQVLNVSSQKYRFLIKENCAAEMDNNYAIYALVGDIECHDTLPPLARNGLLDEGNLITKATHAATLIS